MVPENKTAGSSPQRFDDSDRVRTRDRADGEGDVGTAPGTTSADCDSIHHRLRTLIGAIPIGVAVIDADGRIVESNSTHDDLWNIPSESKSVGRGILPEPDAWDSLTEQRLRSQDLPAARACKTAAAVSDHLIEVSRPDGRRATLSVSAFPVLGDEGQATEAVMLSRDVTESLRAKELDATLDAIRQLIHSTLEHDEILQRALESTCKAFDASWGAILSYDDQDVATVTYQYPEDSDSIQALVGVRFTPEQTPFTALLRRDHQTLIVPDTSADEMFRGVAGADEGGSSFIAIPLMVRGEVPAGLGLVFLERRSFSESERAAVRAVGSTISSALEHAQLYEELRRTLAQVEDRDRMIRRAYSDVIDAVTGGRLVILDHDEMDQWLPPVKEDAQWLYDAADLAAARSSVRDALDGIEVQDDLVLAFGEGITNALKHAGGGAYRVFREERRVRIVVSDSGPGIDFANLPKATLLSGYSSKQSLGVGFTVMLELADRVVLCTDADGTTLVLVKDLE